MGTLSYFMGVNIKDVKLKEDAINIIRIQLTKKLRAIHDSQTALINAGFGNDTEINRSFADYLLLKEQLNGYEDAARLVISSKSIV